MSSTEDWWYKTHLPEVEAEEKIKKEKEKSKNLIEMVEEMKKNRKKYQKMEKVVDLWGSRPYNSSIVNEAVNINPKQGDTPC